MAATAANQRADPPGPHNARVHPPGSWAGDAGISARGVNPPPAWLQPRWERWLPATLARAGQERAPLGRALGRQREAISDPKGAGGTSRIAPRGADASCRRGRLRRRSVSSPAAAQGRAAPRGCRNSDRLLPAEAGQRSGLAPCPSPCPHVLLLHPSASGSCLPRAAPAPLAGRGAVSAPGSRACSRPPPAQSHVPGVKVAGDWGRRGACSPELPGSCVHPLSSQLHAGSGFRERG